jgi:hypothetical protein
MRNAAASAEEIADEDNGADEISSKRASATKLQNRALQEYSQEPLLDKIFSEKLTTFPTHHNTTAIP